MQNPTEAALLEVRNVSQTFKRDDGELVRALAGVSLTVRHNETVALVGESGSGKSSLARVVLCLSRPDAGEVYLQGQRVDDRSVRELRGLRTLMQPVFQDSAAAFNPRRTVHQIMLQAAERSPAGGAGVADIVDLLEQVRLSPGRSFLDRFPHELSGGQRQRLNIARALAVRPKLVIADEPLSGADVSIRGQVLNLFKDLQQRAALSYLFITHDMSIARAFADRVAVMYKGEIVEQGNARDVFESPRHPYTLRLVEAASVLEEAVAGVMGSEHVAAG